MVCLAFIGMLPAIQFDPRDETPIYRQLFAKIKESILSGGIGRGERLPPTRELAGLLGLNRTTVSAAYELLEAEGLIRGHVGRGSFVEGPAAAAPEADGGKLDWDTLIPAESPVAHGGVISSNHVSSNRVTSNQPKISFASSRPSEVLFPLDEFRATCREVIDSPEAAQILQLGPASGYGPLRRYLLEQARQQGSAGPDDDILITSGCQQACDLLQRVLAAHGETVLL
jgi:2-aminoadipate transaminase